MWSLLRRPHYLQFQASSAELRSSHYATQDSYCRRSLAERHSRGDTSRPRHRQSSLSNRRLRQPQIELSGNTVPLRVEDGNLYSLVFDLSVDSHEGKELAMNMMNNAQLWHRRLEHLNKRSLGLMQRRDGNGVAFDSSIDHCDVCAVGKSHQPAHPKKAKHADITAPFQLVYGDLMGSFKPTVRGGYDYVSKITDQFTKWTAVYLLCIKNQALASLQLFVTSTFIPFCSRIVTWRADKGGE